MAFHPLLAGDHNKNNEEDQFIDVFEELNPDLGYCGARRCRTLGRKLTPVIFPIADFLVLSSVIITGRCDSRLAGNFDSLCVFLGLDAIL